MVTLYTEKIDFGKVITPAGTASVVQNVIVIPLLSSNALTLSSVIGYPVDIDGLIGVIGAVDTTLNTVSVYVDLNIYEFPSNLAFSGTEIKVYGVDTLDFHSLKNIVEDYNTTSFSGNDRLVSRKTRFKAICSTQRIKWTHNTIEMITSQEAFLKYHCNEGLDALSTSSFAYRVSLASKSLGTVFNKGRQSLEFHIASNIKPIGVDII
jgi:hypothetical protein